MLRLDQAAGTFEAKGDSFTYVREPVAGTPWHVILTTPTTTLYEPVQGASQVSWLLFAAFAITGIIGLVLFFRLARAHTVAAALARLDALTLLPNRRAAEEHLARTASAAARHSHPYGVLMIDIDRFKNINDTYGHQAADDVLCLAAIHAADAALYDAKLSGRNKVVIQRDVARDPEPTDSGFDVEVHS